MLMLYNFELFYVYFPQSLRTFPVFSIVFFLTHFNFTITVVALCQIANVY